MTKRILAFLLSLILLLGLTACARQAEEAPADTEPAQTQETTQQEEAKTDIKTQDLKIGFCMSNTGDAFVTSMLKGIMQKCEEYGIELVYQGPNKSDYTLQTPILESMMLQDLDALIIVPAGGDNMLEPITAVKQQYDIPIITCDIQLSDESVFLAHITSDNYAGGQKAAEALDALIQDAGLTSGQVASIGSRAGVDTNEKRLAGWQDGIEALGYDVVSVQWCNNEPATAASQAENILLSYPDIAGFFGGNLFAAQGCINGVEATGSDAPIVCFDAGEGQVEALTNGSVDALIVQKPMMMGSLAVDYLVDYFENGTIPEQYTYLEPIICYQDDLDNEEITQYFYTLDY